MRKNALGKFIKNNQSSVTQIADKVGVSKQAIWSKTVYPYDSRSLKISYVTKLTKAMNIKPLELAKYIIENERGN